MVLSFVRLSVCLFVCLSVCLSDSSLMFSPSVSSTPNSVTSLVCPPTRQSQLKWDRQQLPPPCLFVQFRHTHTRERSCAADGVLACSFPSTLGGSFCSVTATQSISKQHTQSHHDYRVLCVCVVVLLRLSERVHLHQWQPSFFFFCALLVVVLVVAIPGPRQLQLSVNQPTELASPQLLDCVALRGGNDSGHTLC